MSETKLKLPTLNVTFNFRPTLRPKNTANNKVLSKMLYAFMENRKDGWHAVINTKGLVGYADNTILPVTESSLSCKNKINVFSTQKDEHNRYVHYIRSEIEAIRSSEHIEGLCPLCVNEVYGGYIVLQEGVKRFKVVSYKGNILNEDCKLLLNKVNEDINEK